MRTSRVNKSVGCSAVRVLCVSESGASSACDCGSMITDGSISESREVVACGGSIAASSLGTALNCNGLDWTGLTPDSNSGSRSRLT